MLIDALKIILLGKYINKVDFVSAVGHRVKDDIMLYDCFIAGRLLSIVTL